MRLTAKFMIRQLCLAKKMCIRGRDYANAPQWKETTIKSSLPKELKCFDEIANNMWWAWNYEGRDLFKSLDADLYEKGNANPVLLLER